MLPLSENIVKCMVPFLGRPLFDYLLKELSSQGIEDVVFTSSGRHDEVKSRYKDGSAWGLRIRYIEDFPWRGTAGCSYDVATRIRDSLSDPVMIVYGDSLLSANFSAMMENHKAMAADLTILSHQPDFSAFLYDYHDRDPVYPPRGTRTNYGVMEVNQQGRITMFTEKALLEKIPDYMNPLANAAVYIMSREALFEIPREGFIDFASNLFPRLVSSRTCMAFDIGLGYRIDIGTLGIYHAAQLNALKGNFSTLLGPEINKVHIGRNAKIANSARLVPPCLIGDGVTIEEDVKVKCAIIGDGVYIRRGAQIIESIILAGGDVIEGARAIKVIAAEKARIGAGISKSIAVSCGPNVSVVPFLPLSQKQFKRLLRR